MQALNPTGIQEPPLERVRRAELKVALRSALHEQCTRPGKEHLTWLQFIVSGLIEAAADRVPWATKELLNRAFGRVPIAVDAAITVGRTAAPGSTPDELLARLDMLREEARQLLAGPVVDGEVAEGSSPLPEAVAVGGRTLPAKEDE